MGYFIGWVRTVAARYSPAAYQKQVARAEQAERDLAGHRELETFAARAKAAAESSTKEVERIRKLMNDLRSEKGVPDWASEEKWAVVEMENSRLKAENTKLQQSLDEAIDAENSLRDKLATAEKRPALHNSRPTPPQPKASDSEEKAGAELAAESFVKRKLAHPSTAKFPFFGQAAKENDDGTWTITGTVSAKNSFNLETTLSYACQVKHDGDTWTLVDCIVAESDE